MRGISLMPHGAFGILYDEFVEAAHDALGVLGGQKVTITVDVLAGVRLSVILGVGQVGVSINTDKLQVAGTDREGVAQIQLVVLDLSFDSAVARRGVKVGKG